MNTSKATPQLFKLLNETEIVGNKRMILNNFNVKSIKSAKKLFNFNNNEINNDEMYKILLVNYNNDIADFNKKLLAPVKKEVLLNFNSTNEAELNKKINELKPKMSQLFKIYKHKTIKLVLKINDKTNETIIEANTSNNKIDNLNNKIKSYTDFIRYDSRYSIMEKALEANNNNKKKTNIVLTIEYGNDNIKKTKTVQYLKEGAFNCVLLPIRNFINDKIASVKTEKTKQNYKTRLKKLNKLNEKYFNIGVNEEGLYDIANTLQIDLNVSLPFQNEYMSGKSCKKPLKKFNYINTKLHHAELDEVLNTDDRNTVSTDELYKIMEQLDITGEYYTYTKNNSQLITITTANKMYSIENNYQKAVNEFEIDTGLINCKLCDIKNKDVSDFIRQGNHFNQTINGKDYDEYQEYYDLCKIPKYEKNNENVNVLLPNEIEKKHIVIDMKKAYTNYKKCKYYKGFVGKVTDFRKCEDIETIGYYRVNNFNFKNSPLHKWNKFLNIYNNNNVYFSAELEMLKDNGVSFDVLEGCWGTHIDFDFNDELLNEKDENDIRYYCKYVGSMYCKNLKKSMYIKSDNEKYIENLYSELGCERIENYDENEYRIIYNKKSNSHLSHISGAITSYVRMMVLEQLNEFKTTEVLRVCVDGIYLKNDKYLINGNKLINKLKNVFRIEEDKGFKNNAECISYITNFEDNKYKKNKNYLKMGDYKKHNVVELHLGCGGSGKTHSAITDLGYINPAFYAPSWKLTREKETEYGIKSNTIAKIISNDDEVIAIHNKFNNVIIVDECSMLTEYHKKMIMFNLLGCKIIFCGDIGFQLPPIPDPNLDKEDNEEFKTDGMNIVYHNNNYRVKDENLLNILNTCRNMMKEKKNILDYVKQNFKIIKKNEMDYDYKNDMILCSTHKDKDEYTKKYNNLEKYIITKSDRKYGRGEILLEKPTDTEDYELRHAYTIHSIQGSTAKGKVFIDLNRFYENRMIYTAISRAKYTDQIVLIDSKNVLEDMVYIIVKDKIRKIIECKGNCK